MLRILALFCTLLVPTLAQAIDYPERRIPDVPTTTLNKVEYKCFDTEQYASLLEMSSDYQALRHSYYLNLPASYDKMVGVYEVKITTHQTEISYLQGRVAAAEKALIDQRDAQLAEVKSLKLSVVGWKIVSGVEAALFVVATGFAVFK
jgi:hypothetical protein